MNALRGCCKAVIYSIRIFQINVNLPGRDSGVLEKSGIY